MKVKLDKYEREIEREAGAYRPISKKERAKVEGILEKEKSAGSIRRLSRSFLKGLIADATLDCYGESEEATGFLTALDENLSVPFKATILGIEVIVEKLDMDSRDNIVAVCRTNHGKQAVRLVDLSLPIRLRREQSGSKLTGSGTTGAEITSIRRYLSPVPRGSRHPDSNCTFDCHLMAQ